MCIWIEIIVKPEVVGQTMQEHGEENRKRNLSNLFSVLNLVKTQSMVSVFFIIKHTFHI